MLDSGASFSGCLSDVMKLNDKNALNAISLLMQSHKIMLKDCAGI